MISMLIALALLPLQTLLAGYSARHESTIGQAVAIVPFLCDIGLIIERLRWMWASLESDERSSAWRTTAYATLAIPVTLATVVMAAVCTTHFHRGLRPILRKSQMMVDTATTYPEVHMVRGGEDDNLHRSNLLPARMELD